MAVTHDQIMNVLSSIPDPEMPISIVDLGIIDDARLSSPSRIEVDVIPTFIGCPALDMIRDNIVQQLSALPGVDAVAVQFIYDPPWTVDRITEAGRASLKEHGVSVPQRCGGAAGQALIPLRLSTVPCPFCNSDQTQLESQFGPTRCRMIYYCNKCRNTFEHLKRL